MNIVGNGSQSIGSLATEYTVHSTTTAGVYSFVLDTTAMANGDTLEVKVKIKVESGGADVIAYQTIFSYLQSDPAKISVPVIAPYGFSCSIKQTAGTVRTFPWAVASL